MRELIVYTDGACSGNPGVGGFAALVIDGKKRFLIRGKSVKTTTNNRMELQPIESVLTWVDKTIKEPCSIKIHTDSSYVIVCTNTKMKDGSKKTSGWYKNRANEDLWMSIIRKGVKGGHKLSFVKVSGHAGDPCNEYCNTIAQEECAEAKEEWKRANSQQ